MNDTSGDYFTKNCVGYDQRQTSVEIYYEKVVLGVQRPDFDATLVAQARANGDDNATVVGPDINLDSLGGFQWHLVGTL